MFHQTTRDRRHTQTLDDVGSHAAAFREDSRVQAAFERTTAVLDGTSDLCFKTRGISPTKPKTTHIIHSSSQYNYSYFILLHEPPPGPGSLTPGRSDRKRPDGGS